MSFFAPILRLFLRKPSSFLEEEPFKSIDHLLLRGEFDKASELLKKYEAKINTLDTNERDAANALSLLYSARIMIEQGKSDEAVKKIEDELPTIESANNPLIVIFSNIVIAAGYEATGDLNASLKSVEEGQSKLAGIKSYYPKEHDIFKAMFLNMQGKVIRKKGQIPEAMEALNESIEIFEKYNMRFQTGDPLNTLGVCYVLTGDPDSALSTLDKSRQIYEELSNSAQLLKIYNNRGMIAWKGAKNDEALEDFTKAYEISKELGIKGHSAIILNNMGLIYVDKGEIVESLKNFEESLELSTELGNQPNIAFALQNLGNIYGSIGEIGKSNEYFEKSLTIYENQEMEDDVALVYSNLAQNYLFNQEYEKSVELYEKSLNIFQKSGNLREQVNPLYGLVEVTMDLNLPEKAEQYLSQLEEAKQQFTDNREIEQLYNMSKAKILIKSERVVQRAEAQKLFTEVADGEVVSQQYTIEAMLKLGELLLTELKASPSDAALGEFKALIDRLEDVARSGTVVIIPTLVQVLILKSKLALIDLEVENGQNMMEEAYKLANDNGLNQLASIIDDERKRYSEEMLKYKKMVDNNASLFERLQQTNIESYLMRAEAILKR